MTITFISNYINHHQIPFCNACFQALSDDFRFIQTQPMEQERIAMGWHTEATELPYVLCLYEEEEACRRLIMESDILIAGWSGREDLIQERLQTGKPVIRVSERLYREGQWKAVSPRGLIAKYREHTRYRRAKAYLLCAGAYVPSDFHIIRAYPGKMYRFGYFPETIHYTKEQWESLKPEDGILHIVWAGRFIPLKHPEYMIGLAKVLKEQKIDFRIHMAGSGEMEEELKRDAKNEGVLESMIFYGFLPPEEVRKIMERCHIHVFTSNHLEGWGAVVNESMNSGCAVVANVEAGAVPYLIRHGENGMAYQGGSFDEMAKAVLYLATHKKERESMGRAAYETITELWNAEHAAGELIRFAGEILNGEPIPAKEGPLSIAPVIAPGKMYRAMTEK